MNAEEVTELVNQAIGNRWEQSNAHGVNLRTCLVKPEKKTYMHLITGETLDLWLVLEEDPKERKGYKIVFDETDQQFGLAMTEISGINLYLGPYGTFMETLESM
ncbi:MAG TPA: hypothetical protein VLZ10_20085 [Thermodesulfobacteriota bacterium]|nr:hypothetical protein [Thermodesulfobacteriota bacterium]